MCFEEIKGTDQQFQSNLLHVSVLVKHYTVHIKRVGPSYRREQSLALIADNFFQYDNSTAFTPETLGKDQEVLFLCEHFLVLPGNT